MSNVIELILKGRQDASLDAAFKNAQRDLDALAAKAKATPLTPKVEVKPVNDAKARIQDLERTLQSWQRVAARGGTIMPGDLSQIRAAKTELESLKRGLADLTPATGGAGGGFGALGDALSGAGLGSLVSVASVAGVAAVAAGAAKAAVELGNLGQQVNQQRAYFEVWSGGVAQATANLEAMRKAVGNSMTDSEAMTAGNKLLGMGLARNSDELERLSRMAVMLGGSTRTASESIEEFSLLLANQSILRLDTFGISGARVRTRIEELQAATAGLSREQAFMQAVMEEGTRKVSALEAAGVRATTSAQDLGTAWRQLREVIGQGLAGGVAESQSGLAGLLTDVTNTISMGSGDAQLKLQGLSGELARAKQQLEEVQAAGGVKAFSGVIVSAGELTTYINKLQTEIDYLKSKNAQWGDVGVGAAERAETALRNTAGAVADVNGELADSEGYWAQWAGFAEDAALRVRLAVSSAPDQAWAARSAQGRIPEPTVYASNRSALEMQAQGRVRTEDIYDNLLLEEQRLADQRDKLATQNAKTFQTQYERAAEQAVNTFKGYLAQGMNASVGLLDLRQDIFKPGNNGAFENIYRALDVAKLGDASPWAAQLGLTQEQARKIGADFQRGIFSDQVMGLVDVGQLVNEAKLAELAEQTQTKFAQQIAAKAGVKTNLVSNLFGYGSTGANGAQTGAVAEQQVANAMSQVAVTLGTTIKGKDFAGQIIGYGPTIWGYFETGIVDAAKQSNALREAFEVMAQKAVGKAAGSAPGNGATGAARAGGVTP